jgi:hypothetical protein
MQERAPPVVPVAFTSRFALATTLSFVRTHSVHALCETVAWSIYTRVEAEWPRTEFR